MFHRKQHFTDQASDSSVTTENVFLPRRYHLHWLTLVVLVLTMACMAIIIVPGATSHSIEWERQQILGTSANAGAIQPYWTDYEFIQVSTWSHGWPFEYLRRPWKESDALIGNEDRPVSWTMSSAWPSSEKFYAFSLWKLLADLLIGAVIVVFATTACEIWRRRRGRFQFSLLDTGVFVTLACLLLGWWQFHSRTRAREQAVIASMKTRGSLVGNKTWAASDYHGPDWLRRLVGNPTYLRFCFHVDHLKLDSRLLSADDYQDIRTLTDVRKVHCIGRLNRELAASLASLPKLRSLDGELENYSGRPPEPMLSASGVEQLNIFPKLTSLKLGRSPLLPSDLDILAKMPHIEILQISGRNLFVEDLSRLNTAPALKTVFLRITATNEELRAFQDTPTSYQIIWDDDSLWVDSWEVIQLKIARWSGKTLLPFPRWRGFGVPQYAPERCTSLDLSGALLTSDRLKQLPPNFSEIEDLTLGDVDSAETAMKLIYCCGSLYYLDARFVPLSKQDLKKILTEKEEITELFLQQGPLTVQDFCELDEKLRPSSPEASCSLTIYASTFSPKEVKQIHDALPEIFVEVYRDTVPGESEGIYPAEASNGKLGLGF